MYARLYICITGQGDVETRLEDGGRGKKRERVCRDLAPSSSMVAPLPGLPAQSEKEDESLPPPPPPAPSEVAVEAGVLLPPTVLLLPPSASVPLRCMLFSGRVHAGNVGTCRIDQLPHYAYTRTHIQTQALANTHGMFLRKRLSVRLVLYRDLRIDVFIHI